MSESEPHPPARLILIEDNPADVYLVRQALQQAQVHCEIDHFADGAEAVAFLLRHGRYADAPRPTLVVLDLNLPKLNGREVAQVIRSDPDLRSLPIVVLTSSASIADRQHMAALGVTRYLIKSWDLTTYFQVGAVIKDILSAMRATPRSDTAAAKMRGKQRPSRS
jgi:chemotaxis family two-component system response regulator Rcp1